MANVMVTVMANGNGNCNGWQWRKRQCLMARATATAMADGNATEMAAAMVHGDHSNSPRQQWQRWAIAMATVTAMAMESESEMATAMAKETATARATMKEGLPPRLHIPVFRNLFFGPKNRSCQDSWGFLFFPVFSGGFFHRNVVLEMVAGIPVFCRYHKIFLQEFLWDRNSCIYSRFLLIPPDSSGFLRIPVPAKTVWLWPATKEGSFLSKIWTKIDLF
jgi:hypothetical protein